MKTYAHPIPATAGANSLGGSRFFGFDEVRQVSRGGLVETAVDTSTRDRLSTPRATLCGLSMDEPRIMGILNVTPDSFSDGGQHATLEAAVARAKVMAQDADILDIGGESTRPGAEEVGVTEEIRRTAPVIRAIRAAGIETPISIDTRKARVAEAALDAGADVVNDVSAFEFDPELAALVAERDVPVCLMHSQGGPETMQIDPRYDNVLFDVYDYLEQRVSAASVAGVSRDRIIVDPGIGFGKTLSHNLSLLRGLAMLHGLGLPILLGASRKRFIGKIGGADGASDRMAGSVAVALHAAAQGAQILRVHDTFETRQALRLQLALSEGE